MQRTSGNFYKTLIILKVIPTSPYPPGTLRELQYLPRYYQQNGQFAYPLYLWQIDSIPEQSAKFRLLASQPVDKLAIPQTWFFPALSTNY